MHWARVEGVTQNLIWGWEAAWIRYWQQFNSRHMYMHAPYLKFTNVIPPHKTGRNILNAVHVSLAIVVKLSTFCSMLVSNNRILFSYTFISSSSQKLFSYKI